MAQFDSKGRLIRRKNKNFFAKLNITDTAFVSAQRVKWDFNSTGIALVNEADQRQEAVQYSFDGENIHGDMTPTTPTTAIIFDNRHENNIWFRMVNSGREAVVRVEAWRNEE